MNTSKKIKMTVELEVTVPQALALQAMFDYWNTLAGRGSSRFVSFYADGDGNFRPKAKYMFSEEVPFLSGLLRHLAETEDIDGHKKFDFDAIAWKLAEPQEYEAMLKRIGYDDDEIILRLVKEFERQDEHGKRQLVSIVADEIERRRGIKRGKTK